MQQLKDHTLDLVDWVDYRPDFHWLWFLALPAALAVVLTQLPAVMAPVLMVAAIALAVFILGCMVVAALSWVAWRTAKDLWSQRQPKRKAPLGRLQTTH